MAVFADALEAQGDPRGQLILLQLALEDRPDDQRLLEAEARHLALHAKALLGPLSTASSMLTLRWRRGQVVDARFRSQLTDPGWGVRGTERPRNRLPRLLRELDALPVMARLEQLTVSMAPSSFSQSYLEAAFEAASQLRLESLREVRVVAEYQARSEFSAWDDEEPLPSQPVVKLHSRGRVYEVTGALEAGARRHLARFERMA